ncbi:MAG: M20/M25/M40 family metallo-hydrolase, partial [Candidatus Binatia bacterium]
LAEELERRGLRAQLHRYDDRAGVAKANVVVVVGPPEPNGIILSGHIDTVPFDGQPGWTREPLRLTVEGDRAYGRGITDMKGFLAACVVAIGAIDRRRLRRPVVLLFTADEEVGCLGAERLAASLPSLLGNTPIPREAWIGEPNSFAIHHAHKSAVLFAIRVRGRGGHSGMPDSGVSAIAIAGKALELIRSYGDELRARPSSDLSPAFPESPYATINVGAIHGGTAANVIAEECELAVLYRSLPGDDPLAVHREITARLAALDGREHAAAVHRAAIEVGEATVVPPMPPAEGTRLEAVLRELTGGREARGSLLAADGCRFASLGVATLICGPGEFEQAHQPNESASLAALARAEELIRQVVERLCY